MHELNMLMFGQLSYQKNSRFKTSLTWKGAQSVWGELDLVGGELDLVGGELDQVQ